MTNQIYISIHIQKWYLICYISIWNQLKLSKTLETAFHTEKAVWWPRWRFNFKMAILKKVQLFFHYKSLVLRQESDLCMNLQIYWYLTLSQRKKKLNYFKKCVLCTKWTQLWRGYHLKLLGSEVDFSEAMLAEIIYKWDNIDWKLITIEHTVSSYF